MNHEKITVPISELERLLGSLLDKLGFNEDEIESLLRNLVTAEMAQKHAHGIARALWISENIASGKHNFTQKNEMVFRTQSNYLQVNAQGRVGPFAVDGAIRSSIAHCEQLGTHSFSCGITNIGPYSGFISAYALEAMKQQYIFLSFVDSPGGLKPYGTSRELWGTNPITLGFPDPVHPVLIDFSSAETTWGDYYLSLLLGEKLQATFETTAIDGHKGSALTLLIKLLAGVMTREELLPEHGRTSGMFFLLLKSNPFVQELATREVLETIHQELREAAQPNITVRFPGENTIANIAAAEKDGSVRSYAEIWQKLQRVEASL